MQSSIETQDSASRDSLTMLPQDEVKWMRTVAAGNRLSGEQTARLKVLDDRCEPDQGMAGMDIRYASEYNVLSL